jgi:hypothetical protein
MTPDKKRLAAALTALNEHASTVIDRKRKNRKPTCLDDVPESTKLGTLGEEFGEVCTAIKDDEGRHRLRQELLDTATAAVLWAEALR